MRRKLSTPRILKINKIEDYKIFCVFNNGEHRLIDFKPIFKEWNLSKKKNDFRYHLLDKKVFKTAVLIDRTIGWKSIKKKIKLSNGDEFNVFYELDPVFLFESSIPDKDKIKEHSIGKIVQMARKNAGMTQDELAKKSGTTRYYISRIENDRSDIELGTLRKIIEIGLNKKLNINVN